MRLLVLGKDGDRAVEAAPVDIGAGEEQFAAHRAIDGAITGLAWTVSHIATGFRLASGGTAKEAVEKAEAAWKAKTPAQRDAALVIARATRSIRQRKALSEVLS
jgi:hypothetical protein